MKRKKKATILRFLRNYQNGAPMDIRIEPEVIAFFQKTARADKISIKEAIRREINLTLDEVQRRGKRP
jgi:hypothetical protein